MSCSGWQCHTNTSASVRCVTAVSCRLALLTHSIHVSAQYKEPNPHVGGARSCKMLTSLRPGF
jgi:hypothetical protein